MERTKWWQSLLPVLQSFADINYQRKAWLIAGPDTTSPVEMYCELFDDQLFESFYETYADSFTIEQKETWVSFSEALEGCSGVINESFPPVALLTHPCWEKVRFSAAMLLHSFNEPSSYGG